MTVPVQPRIDELMKLRPHERRVLISAGIHYPTDLGYKTLGRCWWLLADNSRYGDLFVHIVDLMIRHNVKFKDADPAGLNLHQVNLSRLELSATVHGLLTDHHVRTLGLLRQLTEADLRKIKGIGPERIAEIKQKLALAGITLRAR